MESGSINQKFQVPALDGLRGLAALIVILSHTSNVGYFFLPGLDFSGIGKSGVYLFFILSSFLLTLPLLHQGSSIFTAKLMSYYWSRRFFRVYPLYVIYLAVGLISSFAIDAIFGPKEWAIPFRLDIFEFIEHLLLQAGKSVTWSVAVEFKYYFVLPVLAYFYAVTLKCQLLPALLLSLLLMFLFSVIYPSENFISQDVRLGPYLSIFILGALLAVLQYNIRESKIKIASYLWLINCSCYLAVVLIILMIPSVYSRLITPVGNAYFSKELGLFSLLWAVVLFGVINGSSFIGKFLASPAMRYSGNISFSAYLFHPVFIDLMRHFKIETPINAWIVLLLTFITASLSFKLIENRFAKINFSRFKLKKFFI